jgi:hypothetical protein
MHGKRGVQVLYTWQKMMNLSYPIIALFAERGIVH